MQAELAKADLLDLDVPTVTGKTLGENIAGAHILNDKADPLHRQPLLQDRRPADFVGQHRPGRMRGQAQRRCARNAWSTAARPASLTARTTAIAAIYAGKIRAR